MIIAAAVITVMVVWVFVGAVVALLMSRTVRRAEREERVVLEPPLNRRSEETSVRADSVPDAVAGGPVVRL